MAMGMRVTKFHTMLNKKLPEKLVSNFIKQNSNGLNSKCQSMAVLKKDKKSIENSIEESKGPEDFEKAADSQNTSSLAAPSLDYSLLKDLMKKSILETDKAIGKNAEHSGTTCCT